MHVLRRTVFPLLRGGSGVVRVESGVYIQERVEVSVDDVGERRVNPLAIAEGATEGLVLGPMLILTG